MTELNNNPQQCEDKRYEFKLSTAAGTESTYSKTEDELTQSEINLLAGDWLNEYGKLPKKVKTIILWEIFMNGTDY